jgi:D-3-phosphoglycerate dehydrogenase
MPQPITIAFASRRAPLDLSDERAALEPLGARVVERQAADAPALVAALADADVVVNRWGRLDGDILRQLERVRAILQPSTGYDSIDVDTANEQGIAVMNLPFQCIDEVANHAIALFLALNRKLKISQQAILDGRWDPRSHLPIGPITGETWGSLGFGNIARHTARRAQAFGLNVIAYDPYVDPGVAEEMGAELVDLDDLLRRSDYISCHLPLNPQTYHFIGDAQFGRMKPSAIFVNTARGRVVDEAALVRALQSGRIAAAGLDVLEQEPPAPDNPLLRMDNVIVTPHLAGTSDATPPRQRRQAIENLVAYVKGERPEGLVNEETWSRRERAS